MVAGGGVDNAHDVNALRKTPIDCEVVMGTVPTLVAHADWSTHPTKRWMAVATSADGAYRLAVPEPVGETASLLSRLQRRAGGGPFVVGFDFPIGVPAAYARRAGITSFLEELPRFGHGRWARFYELGESSSDISLARPFYPRVPGGTSQAHLVRGLGVSSMAELYRVCERDDGRSSACSLFWTLGANQVGRGAISGWREVVAPALAQRELRVGVWPFHGDLRSLASTADCVLAETYPAEAYRHIGLDKTGWSKRRQVDRQRQGAKMLRWAAERPDAVILPELRTTLEHGFSSDASGEDPFDAVVGLMSMVDVVVGRRDDGAATVSAPLGVEGWILGQIAGAGLADERSATR